MWAMRVGLAEKRFNLVTINPTPDKPQCGPESSKICFKITTETLPTPPMCPRHAVNADYPQGLLQLLDTCPWCTAASSSELRQLEPIKLINILYIHTSDYNRLNFRKDMCNTAYCYVTYNSQSKLPVLAHLEYAKVLSWKPFLSHHSITRASLGLAHLSLKVLFWVFSLINLF